MLFPGDLGFRVAVFFIFGVFPVVVFVLGRKGRIAVARQQEIKRLLVLASEEAARAEIEAIFHTIKVYHGQPMSNPVPVAPHQPAVRPRVRVRRGQATDPHSIAERLRRERIAEANSLGVKTSKKR